MKPLIQKVIERRLLHFVITGGITFAAEYSLFLALYYIFHLSAVVANTVSFVVAVFISFSLNKLWVFGAHGHNWRLRRQFLMYVMVALINLIVTNIAIYYLVRAHVPAFAAKIVLVMGVACWDFLLFRKFIFASRSSRPIDAESVD